MNVPGHGMRSRAIETGRAPTLLDTVRFIWRMELCKSAV